MLPHQKPNADARRGIALSYSARHTARSSAYGYTGLLHACCSVLQRPWLHRFTTCVLQCVAVCCSAHGYTGLLHVPVHIHCACVCVCGCARVGQDAHIFYTGPFYNDQTSEWQARFRWLVHMRLRWLIIRVCKYRDDSFIRVCKYIHDSISRHLLFFHLYIYTGPYLHILTSKKWMAGEI